MCFSNVDTTLYDSLLRPLEQTNTDNPLWSDKCDYIDPHNCSNLNPDGYNLTILQLNIRSLLAHQADLKLLLNLLDKKKSKVDAVLLCETFLTKHTNQLVNIPGYVLINKNRRNSRGGGVAILLKDNFPYKKRDDITTMIEKEVESVYAEITCRNGTKLLLGSLYRAPNTNGKLFSEHVDEVLSRIKSKTPNMDIVLGMDHNHDLLKSDTHQQTEEFLDLMVNSEMWPTITRPTRITQTSATLIDNIFINSRLHRHFDSMLILDDISDHLPSLVLLKQTKIKNKEPIEFKSRKLTEANFATIRRSLNQVDWNGILNSNDCNVNFNILSEILEVKIEETSPLKTIRISGKRCFQEPWLTTGLETSGRICRKLYKASLTNGATTDTCQRYKKYRNMYNRIKRQARINYYNTKCMEYSTNTRMLWKIINQTINKTKHSGSIIPYITVDGIQTSQPTRIAKEFGEHYSKIGAHLASTIPSESKDIEYYLKQIPRTMGGLVLRCTSVTEIEDLIRRMPHKVSYGHDRISNSMLKNLCTSISYPLQVIFNQSIDQGIFPSKMKLAEVIPLYKGKEHDKVINYRPISLLITISKLLEKIIYKRLYSFLEKNKILFESQYGFRSKRSCEQAVMEMISRLLQAKDAKMQSTGIFLDLSKAFDTLNHDILIKKLDLYGIRGDVKKWFISYLSDRSLVAKVNTKPNTTTYSEPFKIEHGAAQGSCLGPLLFIIFCNDIKYLPIYGNLILFADDTTLLNHHKNRNFLQFTLQHDMEMLSEWFNVNKLSLNLTKTVMINFWPNSTTTRIKLNEQAIPLVSNTKFLGVFLDDTLNWKHHIANLHNKLTANKHLIRVNKTLLTIDALRKIYFAHIHSHLSYCLITWGPMADKQSLNKLAKIQNECVKMIGTKLGLTTVDSMYKKLGIIPLTKMIQIELAKYGYGVTRKIVPSSIQALANRKGGLKNHRYCTRNCNTPNIQKHTNHQFNSSFMCKGLITYSALPGDIKNISTLAGFVKKLKRELAT